MADTARTIAELIALFADNTTGDISEQDCRDLIITFANSFGGMYMEGNATATTIAVGNTWYKAAGTTTASANLQSYTMPANNRLTYSDTITRHAHIVGSASVECGSNNQVCELSVYKNGAIVPGSTVEFKCLSAGDPTTIPIVAETPMSPTDYIEVYIKNETGANNLTVTYMNLQVEGNVH